MIKVLDEMTEALIEDCHSFVIKLHGYHRNLEGKEVDVANNIKNAILIFIDMLKNDTIKEVNLNGIVK